MKIFPPLFYGLEAFPGDWESLNSFMLIVYIRRKMVNFISIVRKMVGLINFLLSCALRSSHSHVLWHFREILTFALKCCTGSYQSVRHLSFNPLVEELFGLKFPYLGVLCIRRESFVNIHCYSHFHLNMYYFHHVRVFLSFSSRKIQMTYI